MSKERQYFFEQRTPRHYSARASHRSATAQAFPQAKQRTATLRLPLILLCPLVCLYYEFIFHLIIFHTTVNLLFPLLFAIPTGVFLAFLIGLMPRKIGQIVLPCIFGISTVFFSAQTIYYSIFKTFFSFYSMQNGGQVTQFMDIIGGAILKNIVFVVLYVAPVILCAVFRRNIAYGRYNKAYLVTTGVGSVALMLICVLLLAVPGKSIGSPYELYHNYSSADQAVKKLGLSQSMMLDLKNLLFGRKSGNSLSGLVIPSASPSADDIPPVSASPSPTEDPVDTSPNILNIDFEAAAENAPNDDIRTLCEYFQSATPTNKNEYTGMFEGYNLIFLTAESFSPWCVDEELTPTLYKLVNNGFVFDNFYNGLWGVSTSDGEYVNVTGLIPEQGIWSMRYSGEQGNDMWSSYGKMFRENGYSTYAFHDNTYDYYGRDVSHPNLGYDYYALGKGLDLEECWPESDKEMMEKSLPYYINDDLFHVYYMTVSGHMNYSFSGNMMAYRHEDEVAGLPYSEAPRAYIACNIELDRALEYLIDELDKAGKLDKTVIVMAADHYPYGLTNEEVSELLGHTVDPTFELYKSSLVIWNSQMTEPIHVKKYGYAIDINPTVMNLFGMPYDSRMVMGHDLLSDSDQFMFLLSRSFVTDVCMYNSDTGEATPFEGKTIPDGYVDNVLQEISTKYMISTAILENDFYAYIRDYIQPSQ